MIRGETAAEKKAVRKLDMRPIMKGLYPVAFAIMLNPLFELAVGIYPAKEYGVSWRFGTAGLLLKSLVVPLFGLGAAAAIAAFLDQRRALRAFAFVALAAAATTTVVVVMFALDYLQIRHNIAPQLASSVAKAAGSALIIGAMMVPVALSLGIGAWRAGQIKGSSRQEAVRSTKDTNLLVQTPPHPKESAT